MDSAVSPSKFLDSAYKRNDLIYRDQDLGSGRNKTFSIPRTSKLKVDVIEV